MPSLQLLRLLFFAAGILFSISNLTFGYEKGLLQGQLYFYLGEDGQSDVCGSGIYIGYYWLGQENQQLIVHEDNLFMPAYEFIERGRIVETQEILTRIRNPNSKLCARYDSLSCYRGMRGQEYLVGPCTPEEIAKFRYSKIIIVGRDFAINLTIKGADIKVRPMEACCLPGDECQHVPWQQPSICPKNSESAGKFSTCNMCNPVYAPTGSSPGEEQDDMMGCCMPGGICRDFPPEINCKGRDGIPLGKPCNGESDPGCADLLGACMVGEKCLELQSESSCKRLFDEDFQRGVFLGRGIPCPPKSEKRACCVNGVCNLETEKDCKDGEFMPLVTACEHVTCPEPKIGCCLPGGDCRDLTQEECGMRCGKSLPAGQQCSGDDEADCTNLLGACMVGEECVPLQTKCSCASYPTDLPTKFLDPGSGCLPPEPELGACCIDGKCDITTKDECEGNFLEGVTTCESDPCLPPEPEKGACCVEGKCTLRTKEICEAMKDAVFLEGVAACADETCPKPEPAIGGCC